MGPRVVLIVNPSASGVTPALTEAVVDLLATRCDVAVVQTQWRGHASELARAAAGEADALVVFAGDGTYNEAINGVRGPMRFGFLPGGGASVFPRALGLPRDPLRATARVLAALEQGRTRSISLGVINGRRFCFAAGIGFDAEIVRRVDGDGHDRHGRQTRAFLAATVAALAATRFRIPSQLEVEGYGRAALLVAVNGTPYTYAGRLRVALSSSADFAAGLDFVAPRDVSPLRVAPLTLRLLRGTLAGSAGILWGHDLDGLRIRCDRPLPAQADGEDLGDLEAAELACERDAIAVLC